MSSYDSSQSEVAPLNADSDKPPFQYDYFLSKSIDLLLSWNQSSHVSQRVPPGHKNVVYLKEEAKALRQVDKFRTVSIIRTNAFIHTLRNAFHELAKRFAALFHPHPHLHIHPAEFYEERLKKLHVLEEELRVLLAHLLIVLDQGLQIYFSGEESFEHGVFEGISSLYTFVGDPRLLWDLLGAQAHLVDSASPHMISLGGNYSYYQNILRSFLKRNLHLRQIFEKVENQLHVEGDWRHSLFIVKVVSMTWGLPAESGVEEREKRDFIDCLKGLFFHRVGVQGKGLYYRYIFTSIHLEYLEVHRMFKNYNELEQIFISVLEQARQDQQLMCFVEALQLNLLPFDKRKQAPRIQQLALDIIQNYIGAAKDILNQHALFPDIPLYKEEQVFASSKWILEKESANGLVDLLMRIQEGSKEAFSLGGLEVHRLYLRMIDLLKHIYLSFQHGSWLFPPDLLLYIPLHHLIDISDDIRQQVKKALFTMVSALGEDQLSRKIVAKEGHLEVAKVTRGEQLQVVLLFLEACRRDQEYIILPEVLPRNLETSILYVKSLQARLGLKEPPADQKTYIIENLRFCEQQKVNIRFSWFEGRELMEDRVLEFNFQKDLAEEWMRQLYRQAINERERQKVEGYFEKYQQGKLGLIQMSEMLRYNHGIDIWQSVKDLGSVKQDDIFDLLQMIRVPLLVNFDIFALTLDEQISLNYAHICLGLYNISYKEAEGNEVYLLILEKIMLPYLRTPNSTATKFKTKYPCFFQRWIYTYHIPALFLQLGTFIAEHGTQSDTTKDAVDKIKMLGDLLESLQSKQKLEKVMNMEQLTTSLIQFSTTLSEDTQPPLYIAAVDLYCLLLTRFLQDSEEITVQFILNTRVLSNIAFVQEALRHVKIGEPKKAWQPSLLNEMLRQLPEYMNAIGLRRTFQIISTYYDIMKPEADDEDSNVKALFQSVLNCTPTTFIDFLLQFLLRLRKLTSISRIKGNQEPKYGEQRVQGDQHNMMLSLQKSQNHLRELKERGQCSLEGINLSEVIFLDDLIKQLNPNRWLAHKQLIETARRILKQLLEVSSKEDLMFFAERLEMVELVLCGGRKEEELLVSLIVDNGHRQAQTELLKKILRENRKLSDAANRAIDILSLTPQKVHYYHINRLIQINSRYPSERIQQFLIANLSCQRNNSPAKINQKYLASDLSRLLQKLPKRICEELLLRPISGEDRDRLIELVSNIFQKLLYLPLKKFDNISLATVEEAGDEEEWNTESQGEETEDKRADRHTTKVEKAEHSQSSGMQEEHLDPSDYHASSIGSEDEDNYYRPDFLEIFTSEGRKDELRRYEKVMLIRQELDVLVGSDYSTLNQLLKGKEAKDAERMLRDIAHHMNGISSDFTEQIAVHMPEPLYHSLKQHALNVEVTANVREKYLKRRQPSTIKPHWLQEFFSDRAQSDDSEVSQNAEQGYGEEEEDYDENEDYDDQGDEDEQDEEIYYDENDYEQEVRQKKAPKPKAAKKGKGKKEGMEEPPQLLPTYSKIEQEMSGGELKRQEMVKLLEIALYMLLRLPQSQIRCRQVSSFYLQLLNTSFGQTFLQSFFTTLRFDETGKNLQTYASGLKGQCGLQEVSLEDAINNVLFLLRQLEKEREGEEIERRGNLLFKDSGTLLPIAQEMIGKFQLPLQNNCLTLLLIYIATNKTRIRSKIAQLNFQLQGGELGEGQKVYRLSRKELARIIDSICRHRSSNRIWELIQQTMGLQVKLSTKLLECIRGYGSSLYSKVVEVSRKIAAAVRQGEKERDQGHMKGKVSTGETHHIVSRLVQSCRQQIKQFYFINKETLIQIFNKENLLPESCNFKQLPKLLLKLKQKLMKNRQLMQLTEAMFYFLRLLRQQFYGRIEDKLFQRLIHYPKMLLEAGWYYVFMMGRGNQAIWTSPGQVDKFFQSHPLLGSYQFRDLQQVFNLVLHFLQLESFCCDKFKQLLIPVLMRNPTAAQQVGLRFKVPRVDDDINCQNILVTRKCSFDMAFYQLTGQAISVQFHEEEGSDHGGLVRELMIGWRGRGVGEEAFFIGKILGISFRQGVPYGGALDMGMFIAITNYSPTIDFFQEIDPEIYRSLAYIRDNDPSDLCLRFVVEKTVNGCLKEVQLIEGGAAIQLTNVNKEKYLKVYCQKYFHLARENQLKEIQAGFNSVVYPQYAQIFTPQQILRQIRGEEVIDVKMLVGKARYEGYSEQSPVIKWFWEIVQGFNQDLMNTFIQFVTGSPKITVFNSNFNITIEKVYDVNCLPVAHTCFNTLDLPEYSSKKILEKKLMTAICEGNNSFGIL